MDKVDEGSDMALPTISLIRRYSESDFTSFLMKSIIYKDIYCIHYHIILYCGKVRHFIENRAFLSRHYPAYIPDQVDQAIHSFIFLSPEMIAGPGYIDAFLMSDIVREMGF